MKKQIKAVTLNGKEVVIDVNPSGFIKVSNGEQTKSQALVSFARAYFANPSMIEITPLEHGVTLSLADGSVWFVDAETLIIMRLEEGVEANANVQTGVKSEQDEQATKVKQLQSNKAAPKETQKAPVNGTEQAKPKRGMAKLVDALSSILKKVHGLTDSQIDDILNALNQSKASPSRQVYKFDESTPEGKIMARLARLYASVTRPIRIGHTTVTIEEFTSPNGLISYRNKTIYARVGDEIVQFPPAN